MPGMLAASRGASLPASAGRGWGGRGVIGDHVQHPRDPEICIECGAFWPCLVARLADALEQATKSTAGRAVESLVRCNEERNSEILDLKIELDAAVARAAAAERRVAELQERAEKADGDLQRYADLFEERGTQLVAQHPVIAAALVWESDSLDSDETEQALLEAVRVYRRRSETS